MNTKEILIAARALISDRAHWAQDSHAVTQTGMATEALDPAAYAFCADGAVCRAAGGFDNNTGTIEAMEALERASYNLFNRNIVQLNDQGPKGANEELENFEELCHGTVLAAFDYAIANA